MQSIVATNTKRIIRAKGLKQKTVARDAGLQERTLSAMLNGRKQISDRDIANICKTLNVEPNELFKQEV
jgi:transcriptional regulator with XRE-family HTH domain